MTYDLYADVVFFDNFVMDFLLLCVVEKVMKLKKRRWGIPAASAFGALYALAVTVFPLPGIWIQAAVTYILMSAAMTAAAFRIQTGKELVKATAGLYLAAAVMAGLFGLFHISEGPSRYLELLLLQGGFGRLPFIVYLLLAAGCFFMACCLWETVRGEEKRNGHLYRTVLYYNGKRQELTAFLDTGNRLKDPLSQKPVSIISADCCKELFRTVSGVRYIPFSSVGRERGVLPAVKADRMEIEREGETFAIEHPLIAISKEPLSPDGTYQMLLHENIWL